MRVLSVGVMGFFVAAVLPCCCGWLVRSSVEFGTRCTGWALVASRMC